MLQSIIFAAALSGTVNIDVVIINLPDHTQTLVGCYVQEQDGISADCQGSVSTSGIVESAKGYMIDFAAFAPPNFEWFSTYGQCVFISKTIGEPWHENRYTLSCGEVIFQEGFDGQPQEPPAASGSP